MLMTETNTRTMESRVRRAARTVLGLSRYRAEAVFEHGQWWLIERTTGRAWSVVDCETANGYPYLGFEQVARGDED